MVVVVAQDQPFPHRIIMVPQHLVVRHNLDVTDAGRAQDALRGCRPGQARAHRQLVVFAIDRLHPGRRPQRQPHRSNDDQNKHQCHGVCSFSFVAGQVTHAADFD
jgi:hypothetical protein